MKTIKKLMTLVLSIAMVLAMGVTAFAADITISGGDTGSEYAAYKLLNLTTSTEGDKTNYSYTLNSKYKEILKSVTGKTTEKDIVDYISKLNEKDTRIFADAVYAQIKNNREITADATTNTTTNVDKFTDVAQGYYLIAETTVGTAAGGQTGSYSLVMLDTAGQDNIAVNTKESVPTVVKKVKDVNDSTGVTTGWQDSADADVGDELEYQLTGTVSAKIGEYKTYYYEFVDAMTRLTYVSDPASCKVFVDGVDCTLQFTVNWDETTKTLKVICNDLKKLTDVKVDANTQIVVTYKATLDANAVVGSTGNPNEVYLKYSNNPYGEGTGKTPVDKNIVFTYKTVINKVKEDGKKPLTGATFTLEKFVKAEAGRDTYENMHGNWVAKSTVETAPESTFTFSGLDDGYYRLTETNSPAGYNKLENPIYFTISATHDVESDNPGLTDFSGKATSGDATFTPDKNAGSLTANVVNKTGTQLPSTGGMGTTIFYVVGTILVLAAVVLLITKKRMHADK